MIKALNNRLIHTCSIYFPSTLILQKLAITHFKYIFLTLISIHYFQALGTNPASLRALVCSFSVLYMELLSIYRLQFPLIFHKYAAKQKEIILLELIQFKSIVNNFKIQVFKKEQKWGGKYTSIPHFTALHFTAFFYIVKASGNFVSSESISTMFPTAFIHFTSVSHFDHSPKFQAFIIIYFSG